MREGKSLREGWASQPSSPEQGLQVERPWGRMSQPCLWGGRETGQLPQDELFMGSTHVTLKFLRDAGTGLPLIHREK